MRRSNGAARSCFHPRRRNNFGTQASCAAEGDASDRLPRRYVVRPTDLAADHVNRKVGVIVAKGGTHARPRTPFLAASMREIHRIWRPSARKPDGAQARIGSTWYPTA
jgi:hypothetical protein